MVEVTQADRAAAIVISPNQHAAWFNEVVYAFARYREQAAADERARIVAWLRGEIELPDTDTGRIPHISVRLADAIEAGEHLKDT